MGMKGFVAGLGALSILALSPVPLGAEAAFVPAGGSTGSLGRHTTTGEQG